ncbi:MAG: gamma-glutamyl-gamma-aminobutyrate hydrolase family protein [Planctomycetes bacterium]|jgi:putative glutamine amidotransferase|nr:gamma-glutamyl-gamma-aminobutyrate hydrolase family protein [Planctomycetota bacterium]
MPRKPLIGITADLARDDRGSPRHQLRATYVESVARAGGIPVILPADGALREEALAAVDGVLITGGDDIDTRPFGVELHPMAKVMDPARQASEFALLRALDARPSVPVLGICLGMQLMGVHRGGRLIQHLDDVIPDAGRHRGDAIHTVHTELGSGPVASWHHQALADAPGFEVIGHSDDGVIEAIRDRARPFFVGVQWHPERTPDQAMGDGVVRRFVESARPK